jgi:hypothetical protein
MSSSEGTKALATYQILFLYFHRPSAGRFDAMVVGGGDQG